MSVELSRRCCVRRGDQTVKAWPKEELRKIAATDDLHIAPLREDGETYGTPTWIWAVVVDDALYVRGYNGQKSRWYQAAVQQKAGRIIAAGMTKEVAYEPFDGPRMERVDEAYRARYRRTPYLRRMVSRRARAARFVDAIARGAVDRLEGDFLYHPGGDD